MSKLFVVLCLVISLNCLANDEDEILIKDKPLVCDREAYNCPHAKGKMLWKRLKDCEEVKLVWSKCKNDIHGLDADHDNKPCEAECR